MSIAPVLSFDAVLESKSSAQPWRPMVCPICGFGRKERLQALLTGYVGNLQAPCKAPDPPVTFGCFGIQIVDGIVLQDYHLSQTSKVLKRQS